MKGNENRKFFRIRCKVPICTQISIVKVNDKSVNTGTGHICLEDISPGGLKFLSGLDMPVSDMMTIEFKLTIKEELKAFYGYILRKEELDNGIYRYGVKFINDGTENEDSIRMIYELNKRGIPNQQKFCYNVFSCFKKYNRNKVGELNKNHKVSDKIKVMMYNHIVNDNSVKLQYKNIFITNISSEGMEFTYDCKLPDSKDDFYDFKIYLMGRELSIEGNIVHTDIVPEDGYRYTIKFNILDSEKKLIADVLKNELEVSLTYMKHKQRYFMEHYIPNKAEDKNFERWV